MPQPPEPSDTSATPDVEPARKRRLGRRELLVLAVAVLVALAVVFVLQRQRPTQELTRTQVVEAALNDPGSPRIGAMHPDVTVVVFTDFRCPICRGSDPAIGRLLAKDPGVQVVFKNLAVFGPASRAAAKVAMAAHAQGRYLPVHRALMSTNITGDPGQLQAIAIQAGVDWPKLAAELAAHDADYDAQIRRHFAQSWALGIRGTPAYIIGPHLVQGGLDDAQLEGFVADARRSGWR